jgi:hypothetical protein
MFEAFNAGNPEDEIKAAVESYVNETKSRPDIPEHLAT